MKKTDLLIGFITGIIATTLGTFLFLEFFTEYGFLNGIQIMKGQGYLGKIITLGAILNLILFFIFLQKKQDMKARGVILSTIILTLVTLFL
ncbi:hypothetical protein [Flavobacterium sp. '19STA2R22 D10 B1']|uniref:hypothetical protein n=1 Tax=Flavobacterium aerium TaxID=3037261 RepID=UPI00278C2FC8|nr:hypothetical protein [Flavobacterium sp. '19STA2R22 D10 B1']